MRAAVVRRAGCVNDCQLLAVPQWLECRHRWVQSKEPVKINHRRTRDSDRRPHLVISWLAMRDNDVQSISRTSLEENDHPLFSAAINVSECSAREKAGNGAGAN